MVLKTGWFDQLTWNRSLRCICELELGREEWAGKGLKNKMGLLFQLFPFLLKFQFMNIPKLVWSWYKNEKNFKIGLKRVNWSITYVQKYGLLWL